MEVVTYFIRLLPFEEQLQRAWLIVGNNLSNILIQSIAMIVMGSVFPLAWMRFLTRKNCMNRINYWLNFTAALIAPCLLILGHFDSNIGCSWSSKIKETDGNNWRLLDLYTARMKTMGVTIILTLSMLFISASTMCHCI